MTGLFVRFELSLTIHLRDRGWAWSRALLGIPAKEVHVCGNESVLNVIKSLCNAAGEDLQVSANAIIVY